MIAFIVSYALFGAVFAFFAFVIVTSRAERNRADDAAEQWDGTRVWGALSLGGAFVFWPLTAYYVVRKMLHLFDAED